MLQHAHEKGKTRSQHQSPQCTGFCQPNRTTHCFLISGYALSVKALCLLLVAGWDEDYPGILQRISTARKRLVRERRSENKLTFTVIGIIPAPDTQVSPARTPRPWWSRRQHVMPSHRPQLLPGIGKRAIAPATLLFLLKFADAE